VQDGNIYGIRGDWKRNTLLKKCEEKKFIFLRWHFGDTQYFPVSPQVWIKPQVCGCKERWAN
jgi:hypothetical protein